DHVEVARTLVNLGGAWRALGQPGRAKDLYERALPIWEREYGPDHVEVARTLTNLGIASRELGQPGRAKDLLERALAIKEREYGPDHVEVALTLGSLGIAWQALGDRDQARTCWERARRIYRAQDPPRPHDVAWVEGLLRQLDVIPLDDGTTAVTPNPAERVDDPDIAITYDAATDIALDDPADDGSPSKP
ncbi:MAG: tetratricopeptide repeat protein, partial [Actinobacteria bacterium]|nr:tetratricopeptide repeat protein [Actinomycetota bacterium]